MPDHAGPRGALLAAIAAFAAFAALSIAGCGLGAGDPPGGVELLVTRDFGAHVLRHSAAPKLSGEETAMSLLMRNNAKVTTRFGGGFVQSIDGVSGGQEAGQPVDWFYYVNGVQAKRGAASTKLHPGDHIWWDRHDWSQTEEVPAVVGSFPEPFLHGMAGKRLPVRVDCVEVAGFACRTVAKRLRELGVPAGIAGIGGGGEPQTLHAVVGPWSSVRRDLSSQAIDRGPRASGVYARFSPDASRLSVFDENGHPVRSLPAGTGLIAATRHGEDAPVWVITGTDAAGVDLAAHAFEAQILDSHFAVAVTAAGTLPLPEAQGASR